MNNYFKRVSRSTSDFIYIYHEIFTTPKYKSQICEPDRKFKIYFYLNDWFIYKYTIFKTFSEIIIVYNLI